MLRFGLYKHIKSGNWYRALDLVRPTITPKEIHVRYEQLYESTLRTDDELKHAVVLSYGTKWTREIEEFKNKFMHYITFALVLKDELKIYRLLYNPMFERMKHCSYSFVNNSYVKKTHLTSKKEYMVEDVDEYKLIKGLCNDEFQTCKADIKNTANDTVIYVTVL